MVTCHPTLNYKKELDKDAIYVHFCFYWLLKLLLLYLDKLEVSKVEILIEFL